MPDNRVGHGPSKDAVCATRQCHLEGSPALTVSYGDLPNRLGLGNGRKREPLLLTSKEVRQDHVFGVVLNR